MYYEINEEAARRGHDAYSMFDYVEGSTTAECQRMAAAVKQQRKICSEAGTRADGRAGIR